MLNRRTYLALDPSQETVSQQHMEQEFGLRANNNQRPRARTVSTAVNPQSPRRPGTLKTGKQRSRSETNFDEVGVLDALTFLEPVPVLPPSYSSLAPGKPKPIYPNLNEGREQLPGYIPTVYKVSALSRKLEWISPYELAPQRQWKPVVVELNSTQLNFYNRDVVPRPNGDWSSGDATLYKSRLSTAQDLRDRDHFGHIGLLNPANLARSYSLQYAKVGIAIDYKKKKHILRVRAETEQFLLEFPTVESMIEWYCCLNLGIDNSLDLNRREMPKYRTVPRRRRRYRGRGSDSLLMYGYRSRPTMERFRRRTSSIDLTSLVSKWKRRFSGSSKKQDPHTDSSLATPSSTDPEELSLDPLDLGSSTVESPDEEPDDDDNSLQDDADAISNEYEFPTRRRSGSATTLVSNSSDSVAELPEPAPVVSTPSSLSNGSSGSNGFSSSPTLQQHATPSTSLSGASIDAQIERAPDFEYKWSPIDYTLPSRRKILRDSIRCMTTLSANERWLGRFIVRDAAPMEVAYKTGGSNFYSASYIIPHQQVANYFSGTPGTFGGSSKPKPLCRTLQEYVVSPCGLIPRINEGPHP
ncbi:hypothetical protein OGAPHI_003681 [Ogataea philodendri]|uniref:PH domain-containing protein n=1 Tax=Ogataea philodendri TaxID=1378263 RepID=A0A9P8T4X0_9ASCO|nr:uncharacterized protein OGAPHI_003681 [Ogataea philodendri]KAH3665495.1 hypothetical protein OGAPHI_003681 [Ogataea philodendri]